jgi:hypothetical protein
LREVLQLAADADQRKDALIEEIRAGAGAAKERVDRDRQAVDKDKEEIDRERRQHREEMIQVKGK